MALLTAVAIAFLPAPSWRDTLRVELPMLGHRNWICIVDSAYPAQTAPGIKLLDTGQDHVTVVKHVLGALGKVKHVRPSIYLDQELRYLNDRDAPGISAFRNRLRTAVSGPQKPPQDALTAHGVVNASYSSLPHEEIIAKLEKAGGSFRVLMLKTTCTLPYTSVFLELGCGYWSDGAEQRLRESMGQRKPEKPDESRIDIRTKGG